MQKHILVIGESCEDKWIECKIRLSPESPTLVFNPIRETVNAGMAANTSKNIELLAPDAVTYLITQSNKISKIRYLDETSGYILARVDENDKVEQGLNFDVFLELLQKSNIDLKDFACVVISDYNKGFLTEAVIRALSEKFKELNIPTFLDTKKKLGEWSKSIFCVKINNKEYEYNLNNGISSPQSYCENLLVTKGKEGTWIVKEDILVPTKTVEVANICGCGDTFHAALAVRYSETKDLKLSVEFANIAASFAATQNGVSIVKRQEVENLLAS